MSADDFVQTLDNGTVACSRNLFHPNCITGTTLGRGDDCLPLPIGGSSTESADRTLTQKMQPTGIEMHQDTLDHEDNEEFLVDVMTGSYGEISFDLPDSKRHDDGLKDRVECQGAAAVMDDLAEVSNIRPPETAEESKRPTSLVFQVDSQTMAVQTDVASELTPVTDADESWRRKVAQQTSDSQATSLDGSPSLSSEELLSSGHYRTDSDASGLSELQGTLTFEGELFSFVAEDLHEKIKMSSPKWSDNSTASFPGSRSSTPSLYKQALQPVVPLLDPSALTDLEVHARKIAHCVDSMLENLSGTLHSISSLTVDCMETQERAVCKTCDAVDANIKSMYQLMAKCEELSNAMRPVYKISEEIKEIKRLLELFENIVEHKS